MLKEVAVLKHKIMNEAIQFDNRKMFERSGEPAISFKRFAVLCLFAPCTKFQVTTNVDGANSTKPLLPAGAVS